MVRKLLLLFGLLAVFVLAACQEKRGANEQRGPAASALASKQRSNADLAGEWLYDNNCAECHENPQPELHKQPPNLHGMFRRGSLPSGAPATAAQIRTTIIEGRGTMPAFDRRLREIDVNNLIMYLRKLN